MTKILDSQYQELGTRQFFYIATARQCNRASETSKNAKNEKASLSKWSKHTPNIDIMQ